MEFFLYLKGRCAIITSKRGDYWMIKKLSYEEVLEYSVYDAIKLRADELRGFDDEHYVRELWDNFYNNYPAHIPNHPLLRDYDWVYENFELLMMCKMWYQSAQGFEEYYTFFKAGIAKYDVERDYREMLFNPDKSDFEFRHKWKVFAYEFVDFFGYAFDKNGVLERLFKREDFVQYFFSYPNLYTREVLEKFYHVGLAKLLEYDLFAEKYKADFDELLHLISKHPKLVIPDSIFHDDRVVDAVACTHDLDKFYANLIYIRAYSSCQPYIDRNKRYCDREVRDMQDGILPSLRCEYVKAKDMLSKNDFRHEHALVEAVFKRVSERLGRREIAKRDFYRELSKYIVVGMLLGRIFETSPYNILIDIETFYEYMMSHGKDFFGKEIYEFFLSYEDEEVEYIREFYEKAKDVPLKDMFYDDWEREKEAFVREINESMVDLDRAPLKVTKDGVAYYDITDMPGKIAVSNTNDVADNDYKLARLVELVKTARVMDVSISIQDENHQVFYDKNNTGVPKIKFIYGELEPKRVGIIFPQDAYSQGIMMTESEALWYKRNLYTLDEFMNKTRNYNELTYAVDGTVVMPKGILIEGEPNEGEVRISRELGLPFYYREKRKTQSLRDDRTLLAKTYRFSAGYKKLF